jgi:hypothetical protein
MCTSSGQFVLYRRIVEELLRLADDVSGAADIDAVRPLLHAPSVRNSSVIFVWQISIPLLHVRTGGCRAYMFDQVEGDSGEVSH